MGMRLFMRSASSFDTKCSSGGYATQTKSALPISLPNPDPKNYFILKWSQIGKNLVVKLTYPDCTNYEGKKILLFKDVLYTDLIKQKLIDPHFSENEKFISPFARFEPTAKGWNTALALAKELKG